MTPYAFFRHVERMRAAQKEYFRTRSSEALRVSKRLEREVNKILNERRNRRNLQMNFNNQNMDKEIKIEIKNRIIGSVLFEYSSETDPDPEYNSNSAFFYYGLAGDVNINYKYLAYAVRPVRTFEI